MELNKSSPVVEIGTRYQRLYEADELLVARIRLSGLLHLSDDEYAQKAIELRAKERAWAKRWGIA